MKVQTFFAIRVRGSGNKGKPRILAETARNCNRETERSCFPGGATATAWEQTWEGRRVEPQEAPSKPCRGVSSTSTFGEAACRPPRAAARASVATWSQLAVSSQDVVATYPPSTRLVASGGSESSASCEKRPSG